MPEGLEAMPLVLLDGLEAAVTVGRMSLLNPAGPDATAAMAFAFGNTDAIVDCDERNFKKESTRFLLHSPKKVYS